MELPEGLRISFMSHSQPHVGCAGSHKNARGRAQAEHALHRMRKAGVPLRMIKRRNQTPQLGRIEARLDFDPKPPREHDPKLYALPQGHRMKKRRRRSGQC